MKFKMLMVASFALIFLVATSPLQAESTSNPFYKNCREHASAKAFVNSASYFCVHQKDSKDCHKTAEAYFQYCGFDGDFQALTRRAYTGMLFMFVVAHAPQVVESIPKP
ncbi:MAG: hypothetical protein GX589_03010 [Deltaproteobacteria bacterium]|nr:hypothetical protein [Deltaproteobacteria bacterium]